MPTVSIVIPTYNRSRLLARAIRSVQAQTYQDFETIVVDDGSTDDTCEMIEGLGDTRVRYFHQENRGISAARNVGISHAEGEYVAFLDSDDLWLPRKLEVQMDAFRRHQDVGFVCCPTYRVGPNNEVLFPQDFLTARQPEWVGEFHDALFSKARFGTPSVVVKKDLIDRVGGFDEGLPFAEDWDMWVRLSVVCRLCNVGEPLIACRSHDQNTTADLNGTLASDLELIHRYLGSPADDQSRQTLYRAEMQSYASHGLRGLWLGMADVSEWLREAQARADLLGRPRAVGELLTGLAVGKTPYTAKGIREYGHVLGQTVEMAHSSGGACTRAECLREFFAAWVHTSYRLGNAAITLKCIGYLIGNCGIGAVDRGILSIGVRSALKALHGKGRERMTFPEEEQLLKIGMQG